MFLQIVEFKDGRYGIRKFNGLRWAYFNIDRHNWGTKRDVQNEQQFSGFRAFSYEDAELTYKRIKVKQISV